MSSAAELIEFLTADPPPAGRTEIGTIGWDDVDDHADPGDTVNDGFTLVRVQLYRGKDITKPVKKGIAQGYKLLCMVADHVGAVPAKGSRCYVMLPAGMESVPGAGLIVATVTVGLDRFDNLKDGSRQLTAASGAARVVVKNDGTIVLYTTTTNGAQNGFNVYLRLAPDQLKFSAPWGTLRIDATGFHVTTASGATFDLGGIGLPAPFDSFESYARIQAHLFNVRALAQQMGADPQVPLANATNLKAVLLAMSSKLTALGAALTPADAALISSLDTGTTSS